MEKYDLIDGFFEGTLSDSEKERFEKELFTDDEFANEFAFQNNLRKVVHERERVALKAELKTFKRPSLILRFKPLLLAAVLLIIGLGTLVYFQTQTATSNLYTAYYQPFPNIIDPVVRGESVSSEAFLAYEKEDFKSAEALFSAQFSNDHSDDSYFYWGVCLLQNNKTEKAINHFEKASYDSNENWADYSKWYLALAYIKTGKIDKSKPILEKLAFNKDGFMHEKAAELLLKL